MMNKMRNMPTTAFTMFVRIATEPIGYYLCTYFPFFRFSFMFYYYCKEFLRHQKFRN